MRVACLIFLFALLVAVLAKPRPLRTRQGPTSRFAIVRMAVLLTRIVSLQIRIGLLLIRYGALVVLAAIIAGIRRGARLSVKGPQPPQPGPAPVSPLACDGCPARSQCGRQRPAQGSPCRGESAHTQIQVRARQRTVPRNRFTTKQGWQAPSRRERALRQASTSP